MNKNKYSTPLLMLATILAGMLSPMQSAVNGQLGHWLQDGNACAVISFASGLVVMFFYYYCAQRNTPAIRLNPYSD
ncbi:putative inner membrane protein [Salmonella enterica subsp. enterica serovar Agona str. 400095 17]|nr:putative inner membrane protein [Salmonella enterica subsp. enterica serovar Agona str. 400095 17]CRJ30168.1 inner membrane protein [Salmonella enterica subsp. enterica serovar Typhi]